MTGGNKVVAIYAQRLVRSGHVVKLVSPPPKPVSLYQRTRSLLKGRGWPPSTERQPSQFDDAGLDHTVLDRWRAVSDKDIPDADIVIATWWETAEWVNALASAKGAKAYFIQGHEIFPHLPADRSRATYRLPLHKIVVSKWLQRLMNSEYLDHNVDLVPNSVDHAQFFADVRDKQAVPTVGFLYSRATTKGLDVLTAALKLVRQSVPNLKLVAFGSELPPPSVTFLEEAEFSYRPPQHQIRNIYARCDVWVTASRSEGFNLTAMEAMACRTPIIATRTGWPDEAVNSGWNGLLIDIDDVDGLARGIELVLGQTNKSWKTMSANAFATVVDSSWDASATLFEKALLNAKARASRNEIAGGPSSIQA